MRELLLDQAGHFGGAGEHHAASLRRGHQRRADTAIARQELQHRAWHAGLKQDIDGGGCDERRFLGGLGEHRIARHQRGANLSGEDRQREIPRADADDGSERRLRRAQRVARLLCVVTQEVDRLAHFSDGVGRRFSRLAHNDAHQCFHPRLHQVGGALHDCRAF